MDALRDSLRGVSYEILDSATLRRRYPALNVADGDQAYHDTVGGFARPENRLAFNAVAEGFLGECLGGRVEPIGTDLAGSSITVPAGPDRVAGLSEALKGAAAAAPSTAAPAPAGG